MSEKEIHMAPAEQEAANDASHDHDQSPGEKTSSASVTSRDDLALKFIHEHGASGPVSPEDDRRIRWKIDTRLLPMMMVTLMMQFLDKNALSSSVNFGLLDDMGLHGNEYNWASGSIFYAAYLAAQPLVARLLQVLPIGKYLSISVIAWGVVLMCIAACHNFASLMVCRFILGVLESPVNPAFMIVTAQWYKRDEQPERSGLWNMGLSIAQIIGGLLGYGFGQIQYRDWNPWRWFFIIYGAITVLWGFVLYVWFPDSPMTARWLSEEDRVLAIERVRENRTGIANAEWKWDQCWEAIIDPSTWFQFASMVLSSVPAGGVSSFGAIVIKGFGFSALNTTLLSIPLGAIEGITFIVSGRITSRWQNLRLLLSWISQVPPVIGTALLYTLPSSNKVGRLLCYYIVQTHNVQYIFQFALANANCAGYTKKATLGAIIFVAYCAALIAGPQVFRADEAPVYRTAFLSNFVCFALLIVLIWVWQIYLMWQNRRRDKLVAAEGLDPAEENEDELFRDRTDWQQKKTFRYVY